MAVRHLLIIVALLVLTVPALAVRARIPLEDALAAVAQQDPALFAPLHPSDFRTLDDRIAARELGRTTIIGQLSDVLVRSYEASTAQVLASAALKVDEAQPAMAPLFDRFVRCVRKMGLDPAKVQLWLYGDLEVEAFGWGLPPPDGRGFVGISARTARLFLDGDQGRKLGPADLDFVFTRELAHIAAGHATYRMITIMARTAEKRLDDAARDVLRTLYRTTGLGGVALSAVVEATRPIQRFLVSRAFQRFHMWDLNAAVGAARAGLLAGDAPADRALDAPVRVLLLAMLQDIALVDRVDVSGLIAQVGAQAAAAPPLVRDPEHPGTRRGLTSTLADLVRKLLGLPHPPELPVLATGHAELIAETVRWAASRERQDLARSLASSDPFERGLLAVRRATGVDALAFPGITGASGPLDGLCRALAAHVAADAAAHASDVEGTLLARLADDARELSYLHHVALHRVLETLALDPTLPPDARAKLDATLADSRFRSLLETYGYRAEVDAWLDRLGAPHGVRKEWLEALEARCDALKAATVGGLTSPAHLDAAARWMAAHADPARPAERAGGWQEVRDALADRLEKLGRKDDAKQVRALAD